MRNPEFSYCDFNFHTRVINIPQYFNDFPYGLCIFSWLFSQGNAHYLSRLRLTRRASQ